jgi:BirA family biotin operon repressor/biotin-[acetyl-CoA-carboxylase] ligase
MKQKILTFLRSRQQYVSGEEISRLLGITRSAVWKNIQSLRTQGYKIESIKHHGYRLIEDLDLFNEYEVKNMLDTVPGLKSIVLNYREQTDSTNLTARKAADQGSPDWSLFVADNQSAGRGRLGRSWYSNAGSGLWFSLLLRPQADPARLSTLTLFAGLCTASALRAATGLDIRIKWPNDLVIMPEGLKVCGILTEMILEEFTIRAVILGIGINVNIYEFPVDLKASAVSLALAAGHPWPRIKLLQDVLSELKTRYPAYLADLNSNNAGWLTEYRSLCATLGRQVMIKTNDGSTIEASAIAISPEGDLEVELAGGEKMLCHSGEVSVRGLSGYN